MNFIFDFGFWILDYPIRQEDCSATFLLRAH